MTKTPREEFIELIVENVKSQGLDELAGKIVATLLITPEDLSLEELSSTIGYSLSSVSTSIKFLESTGFITKHKKPQSKKIFLSMEKCIMDIMTKMLKKKQDMMIRQSKETLPKIIDKYKKTNSSKKELEIVENYYKDILFSEKIIEEFLVKVEKHKVHNG